MNKIVLGVAVILVGVIVAAGYVMMDAPDSADNQSSEPTGSENTGETNTDSGDTESGDGDVVRPDEEESPPPPPSS